MHIYVLSRGADYEGSTIKAAFLSSEAAASACERRAKEEFGEGSSYWVVDEVEVEDAVTVTA